MYKMTKLQTFKSTAADDARWKAALARDGKAMSEICRRALDRFAAKSERKNKAEDT